MPLTPNITRNTLEVIMLAHNTIVAQDINGGCIMQTVHARLAADEVVNHLNTKGHAGFASCNPQPTLPLNATWAALTK